MQTVALKPKRAEWTAMLAGLVILCALMFVLPALCVPLAMAAPLLACPLLGRREEPVVWISSAVPAAASLLAGYDPFYAASLMLIGLIPLLIARFIPLKRRPGAAGMLMFIGAMLFSLTVVCAAAGRALGGTLPIKLAEALVRWVDENENREMILRQFAANGLISIPKGYAAQSIAQPLMEAFYQRQMLMSLRLTMENLLSQYLPALFLKSCLIIGLFIQLRLERVHGVLLVVEARTASEKRARVVAPPSFRLLTIPRPLYRTAFVLAVAALMMMTAADSYVRIVGQLCYATFETLFHLLGAAVLVFLYTRNDPERRIMAGVMAAALYAAAPFVLLVIGIADQTFHFRKPQADKPD